MRGHAKHSLGQYASAVDDYDTAVRLNPKDATFYVLRLGTAKDRIEST